GRRRTLRLRDLEIAAAKVAGKSVTLRNPSSRLDERGDLVRVEETDLADHEPAHFAGELRAAAGSALDRVAERPGKRAVVPEENVLAVSRGAPSDDVRLRLAAGARAAHDALRTDPRQSSQ